MTKINLGFDAGSVDAGASSVININANANANTGQSSMSNQVGRWGGLCGRDACRAPNARWWNRGSYMHYCERCAQMLNEDPVNAREAQRRFNGPLCVLVHSDQHNPQVMAGNRK